MFIIDARVQSVLRECEDKIKEITQDNSISILVFSKKIELKLSFEDIVEFICGITGESKKDVMKVSRKRELVVARHLIIYFSHHYCTISKSEIARRLEQDHTTILSAIKKVDDLLAAGDHTVCGYVNDINQIIQSLIEGNDRSTTTRTPDGDGGASEECAEGVLCFKKDQQRRPD
jgi:chromosomal replication initiation ATPase DnaA